MIDPQERVREAIAKIRERGHRLTPQRMAVLKALIAGDDHPSVAQVYERVKADFPMISLATVYQTIALLKEVDEVWELGFGDGGNRYDGLRPYPHPHLICVQCGRIVDLESEALDEIAQQVERELGYRVVDRRLDLFGVCPECQQDLQPFVFIPR